MLLNYVYLFFIEVNTALYVPPKLSKAINKAFLTADPIYYNSNRSKGKTKAYQETSKWITKIQAILDNERRISTKIKWMISKDGLPEGTNVTEWVENQKQKLWKNSEWDYHKYLEVKVKTGEVIFVDLVPKKSIDVKYPLDVPDYETKSPKSPDSVEVTNSDTKVAKFLLNIY